MFFFQACRGGEFLSRKSQSFIPFCVFPDGTDYGVAAPDPGTAFDAGPVPVTVPITPKTLPTYQDCLLCYSTIEGNFANVSVSQV